MQRFEHFIFLVLLAGISTALFIVLGANYRTEFRLGNQFIHDRAQGQALVKRVRDRLSRADLLVDWQRVDGKQVPLQTSVYWRTYTYSYVSDGSLDYKPTPFGRILVTGDRVSIGAEMLTFEKSENIQYGEFLRGSTLCMFLYVVGADVKPDDAHRLYHIGDVPLEYRLDARSPTLFETLLWQHIGDVYNDREYAPRRGLIIKPLAPKSLAVRPGVLYEVYLGEFYGLEVTEKRDSRFAQVNADAVKQFVAETAP